MKNFSISLSSYTRGEPGVNVDEPVWDRVEKDIRSAYEKGGGVSMEIAKNVEVGVGSLQLRADPGRYLLLGSVWNGDRGIPVRWRNLGDAFEHGAIDIAGDEWDARSVLFDLFIVIRVFREVFETGELSQDALLHMQ